MRILSLVFLKGSLILAMALVLLFVVLLRYPNIALSRCGAKGIIPETNPDNDPDQRGQVKRPAFLPAF